MFCCSTRSSFTFSSRLLLPWGDAPNSFPPRAVSSTPPVIYRCRNLVPRSPFNLCRQFVIVFHLNQLAQLILRAEYKREFSINCKLCISLAPPLVRFCNVSDNTHPHTHANFFGDVILDLDQPDPTQLNPVLRTHDWALIQVRLCVTSQSFPTFCKPNRSVLTTVL